MPGIKISKENFTPQKQLEPGIYSVRFDGFEQAYAKSGESINLKPILIIVNNADYHNRRVLEWLNTLGHQAIVDFFHAFGEPEPPNDEITDFSNTDDPKIENWRYNGPLLSRVGRIEIAENVVDGRGTFMNVKRYFCAFPGCHTKHSENLLR